MVLLRTFFLIAAATVLSGCCIEETSLRFTADQRVIAQTKLIYRELDTAREVRGILSDFADSFLKEGRFSRFRYDVTPAGVRPVVARLHIEGHLSQLARYIDGIPDTYKLSRHGDQSYVLELEKGWPGPDDFPRYVALSCDSAGSVEVL